MTIDEARQLCEKYDKQMSDLSKMIIPPEDQWLSIWEGFLARGFVQGYEAGVKVSDDKFEHLRRCNAELARRLSDQPLPRIRGMDSDGNRSSY